MKQSREVETEEGFPPVAQGICPECNKEMTHLKNKYKCFSCGIELEKAK